MLQNKDITDYQILKYLSDQVTFRDSFKIYNSLKTDKSKYNLFHERLLLLAAQKKLLAIPIKDIVIFSRPQVVNNGKTTLAGIIDKNTYLLLASRVY